MKIIYENETRNRNCNLTFYMKDNSRYYYDTPKERHSPGTTLLNEHGIYIRKELYRNNNLNCNTFVNLPMTESNWTVHDGQDIWTIDINATQ